MKRFGAPPLYGLYLALLALVLLAGPLQVRGDSALGWSAGVWLVATVAVVLFRLFNTVRSVAVDPRLVRIRMASGAVKQYLRASTHFQPRVKQVNSRYGTSSKPGRYLVASVQGREEALRLDLPEGMFRDLLQVLGADPARPADVRARLSGTPDMSHGGAPKQFRLSHRAGANTRTAMLVTGGLAFAIGVVVAVAVVQSGAELSLAITLGVMCAAMGAVFLLVARAISRNRAKVVDEIVVGPGWVRLDGQVFGLAQLERISLKPRGSVAHRHLTLVAPDGRSHRFPFDLVPGAKSMPDYDEFVAAIEGTAAPAGVPVELDYR